MDKSLRERYMDCFHTIRAQSGAKIERFFFRWGLIVASHPVLVCVAALIVCGVCGSGVSKWHTSPNDLETYMPVNSPVRVAGDWVEEHFREELRYESIIVEAENVLEPDVLRVIAELEREIKTIKVNGKGWTDICGRYSTWFQESDSGLSNLPEEIKESLQHTGLLNNDCIYQSPLKLWPNGLPKNFTLEDARKTLTKALKSSSSILTNVAPLLSNVQFDEKGRVLSAKAFIINWMLKKWEETAPDWEMQFINFILHTNRSMPAGVSIYGVATRSYDDMLAQVMDSNMTVLFAGFSLIILYVIFVLGRFNLIHQRVYLSLLGVSIVGLAILASYGICFYMGFFFGPVHPILPFLLLGIGVDDMFVIVDCLDNLKPKYKNANVPERIGKAVQNAGVSITVTSFTDIVAFAIGTTTRMPFLYSFCTFAATGIFFLFLFELTFFVGCLTMDEYRVEAKREGCCFLKLSNWKPNTFSQSNIFNSVFKKYIGPTLMRTPVKIFVIMMTFLLVGINSWCVLQIEQKFDPIIYLDSKSYPLKFDEKLHVYFPKYGKRAGLYLAGLNYYEDSNKIHLLADQLRRNPYINQESINIWYEAFEKWMKDHENEAENEEQYKAYLTEFLILTKNGLEYIKDLKFDAFPFGDYNITTSHIPIQYIVLNTSSEQFQAMKSVYNILDSLNLTSEQHAVAYSHDYIPWYTNTMIREELLRNLGLTVLAVGVVTLLVIQELQVTFWVIVCVCFTLIDLIGSMYLFGLTVEISTSIMVLLCAGLTVDYAAHIGYDFTRKSGSGNARAIATLSHMGPAVFNGGFSTFLAFVLLGFSSAYVFTTFFKLFTAVVVYGLMHGLLFLPVILSWLGPPAHIDAESHEDIHHASNAPKATYRTNGYYLPTREGVEVSIVNENGQTAVSEHLLTSVNNKSNKDDIPCSHSDSRTNIAETVHLQENNEGKW